MQNELDITQPDIIFRGDSIEFNCHIDLNLTNYKLTAELFDNHFQSISLADTASGGSDDEIEITDTMNGFFNIYIANDLTLGFKLESFLKIQLTDSNGNIKTIYFSHLNFNDDYNRNCWC